MPTPQQLQDWFNQSYLEASTPVAKPTRAEEKASKLQQRLAEKQEKLSHITNEDVYLKGMQQRFDVLDQLNTQGVDLISRTINKDGTGNIFGTDKPLNLNVERATDNEFGYYGRPLSNVRGVGGQDLYATLNTPEEDAAYYSKYDDNPIQASFEPAVLRSLQDADTYSIEGVTGGAGKGADKTGVYTPDRLAGVDAYEVPHEGSVNASDKKMASQREALAAARGYPTVSNDAGFIGLEEYYTDSTPDEENTLSKELGQTGVSAIAGVGKGVVELADVAQELVTWGPQVLYNKITGENVDIDLIPDEFKKKVRAGIDLAVGYDSAYDNKDVELIESLIKDTGVNLFDPDTWGNVKDKKNQDLLLKAFGIAATNPSLVAGMFTEIIGSGGALGATTKVGGKVASKLAPELSEAVDGVITNTATKINKEMVDIRLSDKLSEVEKRAAISKLEDSYTLDKKAVDIIRGSTMTNADMAIRMNQWIDEYKANNKDENGNEINPSVGKLAQMALMARTASAAEVGSMKLAFGVKDGVKQLTEESKKGLLNALTKASKHFGTAVSTEAVQETFDGIVETIATQEGASKYDGKTVKELLDAEAAKILTGTVLGAAGGGLVSVPKGAYEVSSAALDPVRAKVAERAEKLQAAEAAKAPKSTAQAATEANPNIDPEVLNQEVQRLNQAKLDSDTVSTIHINREAYTAAMDAEQSTEKVSDIGNIEEALQSADGSNKAIVEAVIPFDDAYAEAITQTKEFSSANKEVDTPGSTGQYRNMMGSDGIPYMQELMQKAIEAGAGPEKQKAMLQRINNLVMLANSSTVKELDSLVDSRFNDIKPENAVATIIGSSAASKRHIEALREAEISLSELESKALELKEEVLTRVEESKNSNAPTINEVSVQKIIGGGAKPGVMQWIANLTNGNEASIKQDVAKIKNFVEGQQAKIAKYKKALDSFATANGITIGNHTKADYDKRAKGIPTERVIDVDGNMYSPYSLSSVIKVADKEQVKLNELLALAEKKAPKASASESKSKAPRSSKEVSEDKVPVESKKETTEAPTAKSVDQMSAGEARRALASIEEALEDRAPSPEEADSAGQLRSRISDLEAKTALEVQKDTKKTQPTPTKAKVEETNGPSQSEELFTIDAKGGYNSKTKEAVLLLVKSHKGIQSALSRTGISIKDC